MRDPNCEVLITVELLVAVLQLDEKHFEVARGTILDEKDGTLRLRMYAEHLPEVHVPDALHLVTPVYKRIHASETVLDVVNITKGTDRTDAIA